MDSTSIGKVADISAMFGGSMDSTSMFGDVKKKNSPPGSGSSKHKAKKKLPKGSKGKANARGKSKGKTKK